VSAGHARSRARGTIGGRRSYGYQLKRLSVDDEKRQAVIVEAEAVIDQRIFDECLAGRSDAAISRDLAREKVPTASGSPHSAQPDLYKPGETRRARGHRVHRGRSQADHRAQQVGENPSATES
jgi:hypothetical protein